MRLPPRTPRIFPFIAITLLCLACSAFGGIRAPGKYSGIVIFDRWDGCFLYSGIYLMPVSEAVKEQLRPYSGQAITVNATKVDQPMNPGDGLIQELEVLGPAPEPPSETWRLPSLKGLHLTVAPRLSQDGIEELVINIRNDGDAPATVQSDNVGPTVLAKNGGVMVVFDVSNGRSYAAVTRCSLPRSCGGSYGVNGRTARRHLGPAPGSAVPASFTLAPGEAREIPLTFNLPPGEYQFLAGYGGGVHESRLLASNVLAFDVDEAGRATVAGKSPVALASRLPSRGIVCGTVTRFDGSPLRNARVFLWPFEDSSEPQVAAVAPVEPDGSFRIPSVRPGAYRLSAQDIVREDIFGGHYGGNARQHAARVDVPSGRDSCSYGITLERQPTYVVRGRLEPEEGNSWPDARSRIILRMREGDVLPFELQTHARPHAPFEFRDVPAGTYDLGVETDSGANSESLEVTADVADVTATLPASGGPVVLHALTGRTVERRELSRTESNEHSAQSALDELKGAQDQYADVYGKGFATDLSRLGPPPYWDRAGPDYAGLVDDLPAGRYPGDSGIRFVASGYLFLYKPASADESGRIRSYTITARPLEYGVTAVKSFLLLSSGVIHMTTENRPASPTDPPAEP